MSEAMIGVGSLHFAYGESAVLRDLTFTVATGEFLGVIGPNGSGKTTLLKILAGLLDPGTGSVTLEDRAIGAYPRRELARLVALVPQESEFAFPFTVGEVVMLGRTPHLGLLAWEGARDREAVRRALEVTETLPFASRSIEKLSGGERRRVIIARALAQEPRVLLLDEPTSHLDIKHQIRIHDLLRHLQREHGLTIVTVLHDLNLAAAYCDRLLLLHRGEVSALGAVDEVMTYRNIRRVFETEVYVGVNEIQGTPFIIPMREE